MHFVFARAFAVMSKSQVYMNSASLSLPQADDCISTQP